MKLLLSALCATLIGAPFAFASDCEKKCDKEKKEETLLSDCKKCKKDGEADKEKAEGTLLAEGCKKKDGDCNKDKDAEGTLLAGNCKKNSCDCDCVKGEAEGSLA
jgi:hypothetical protein